MKASKDLAVADVTDLLHKGWMSHDGMWFYHCREEFGMARANQLNEAAIRSLAPLEMKRVRRLLGVEKIETFDEFKAFMNVSFDLLIADFMNARMTFPEKIVLPWEFVSGECFAYKGMQNFGAIADYECGVIHRVACWFDSLGIEYTVRPQVTRCLMQTQGSCTGDFHLHLK